MPPSLRARHQALDPDETDSEIEQSFTGRGVAQRRQQRQQQQQQPEDLDSQDEDEEELEEGLEGEEEEDELIDPSSPPNPTLPPLPNNDPPPSHLRDISTLASWTVSSSKPGCSVPQLRHPSTSLFWQSDGPQPHYLNIHFSKLVRVVALRLYLDFEIDESYTPTKILFLAGSGGNDLVEWGELKCESPRGWVWVDFSGVDDVEDDDDDDIPEPPGAPPQRINGPPRAARNGEASSDSENNNPHRLVPHPQQTPIAAQTPSYQPPLSLTEQYAQGLIPREPSFSLPPSTQTPHSATRSAPRHPLTSLSHPPFPVPRATRAPMPVLRAHLIQVKILENHQNGKDTHLRGLQVFARDDDQEQRKVGRGKEGMGGKGAGRKIRGGEEEGDGDGDEDEDLELLGVMEGEFGVR